MLCINNPAITNSEVLSLGFPHKRNVRLAATEGKSRYHWYMVEIFRRRRQLPQFMVTRVNYGG